MATLNFGEFSYRYDDARPSPDSRYSDELSNIACPLSIFTPQIVPRIHFVGCPSGQRAVQWIGDTQPSNHMTTATSSAESAVHLPTPAERPDGDIVIYDGRCKFCTRQVQNLAKWDSNSRLAFLSLHDPEVAKRFPDLTYDRLIEEMFVVDRAGKRHAGAAAFKYLTTRLPPLFVLAPLMHIPFSMPLWRWGYRQVAQRRYALMGRTEACDDGSCKVHFK